MIGIWVSGSSLQELIPPPPSIEPAQEDICVEHDPHTSSATVLMFHIIITPPLQTRPLRLREGTCLAHGHTVYKARWSIALWVSRELSGGSVCSKTLFPSRSHQ